MTFVFTSFMKRQLVYISGVVGIAFAIELINITGLFSDAVQSKILLQP